MFTYRDSENRDIYNVSESGAGNAPRKKKSKSQKIVALMWTAFLGLGVVIFVLLMLIYNGVIGYMPPIEELEDPHDAYASVIYASDGKTELGRFYKTNLSSESVEFEELPPHLVQALIATEDMRYEDHSGIDFMALGRTLVKTMMMGDRSSGGASTLTQQLAKILYSDGGSRGWKRALQKPIEWMIAIKLERVYTKEEIIKMYLNRFDFLNNAVGIKHAARTYFNKLPKDLEIQEAAVLVGMLKNPTYYNPNRHEDRAVARRNIVLDQMEKMGYLSAADAETLKALPLGLNFTRIRRTESSSSYLRDEIGRMMMAKMPVRPLRSEYKDSTAYSLAMGQFDVDSTQWAEDPLYGWIEKNPRPDGSHYNLYTDGLKIYTTIDLAMQKFAEEAVYEHLGGHLQPAFFNEKGKNGPYTTNTKELSAAGVESLKKQAMRRSQRWLQMKEAGYSDKDIEKVFNKPISMQVFAWVKRDGKTVPGTKTVTMSPKDSVMYMKSILRCGLVSMDPKTGYVKAYVGGPDFNYFQYDMAGRGRRQIGSTAKPFLYTLAMEQDYTPCSTVSNMRVKIGGWSPRGGGGGGYLTLKRALTTSNNTISARLIQDLQPVNLVNKERLFGLSGNIPAIHPLCLGINDVSVKEMVGAYSAFSNNGVRVNPVFVTRIEDNKGNTIYTGKAHRTEVINENAYWKMVSMLMSVVNQGTGKGLRGSYGIHAQMGGKTGTTNYNADSWFVGFTPELVTGVWVGGEERYIHFNNMAFGQGAKSALPIYGMYMRKVYDDPKLPYSQDAKFDFPVDYVECDSEWISGGGSKTYGNGGGGNTGGGGNKNTGGGGGNTGGGGGEEAPAGGGGGGAEAVVEVVEGALD